MRDIFEKSADTLLEIEKAAASKAVKPLLKPFRRVLALLIALWPGDDASPEAKKAALARIDTQALLSPMSEVERVLLAAATEALRHGIEAGVVQAQIDPEPFKQTPLTDELIELAQYVRVAAQNQVSRGEILLDKATTLEDARLALTVANPSIRVRSIARYVTNKASNDGLKLVANSDSDLVLVWRAERDGCLDCLAYQGLSPIKGRYPTGLTFGVKPRSTKIVTQPPLHPHCRCTQWVLRKDVAEPVREALVREAKRSVLRGWSVESESESVRIDAAKRLLGKDNGLPKSVRDYARDAVKRGQFKRGRQFPGTR